MKQYILKHRLYICWILTLVAIYFTLYFGELSYVTPCSLCWYQRVALYSSSAILCLATILNDKNVEKYVVFLCIFGMISSSIQMLAKKISAFCLESCLYTQSVYPFLPLLAFVFFILIATLLIFCQIIDARSI